MKMNLVVLLAALLLKSGFCAAAAESIRACPPWRVTVVDAKGAPIGNVSVTQEWGCNVGGEMVMGTTNAVTDAKGQVTLSERFLEPPNETAFKKWVVQLNSPDQTRPWTTITLWKKGFEITRVSMLNDPRVVWTRNGLETRVVLPQWKPGS